MKVARHFSGGKVSFFHQVLAGRLKARGEIHPSLTGLELAALPTRQ
ncbi:MAG TPA: hypothetical protein VET69_01005 [Terriglobales bacterium]|nr:hypothetical protein [Terriglobales bacterium]